MLPDGSIAIVARALGRFRVVTPTTSTPYARADVALLPDEEELAEAQGMQQPTDIPAHWRAEAARAAAAAASLTWWEAEAGLTAAAAAEAAAAAAATMAAAVAAAAGTETAVEKGEEEERDRVTDAKASTLGKGLADEDRCGAEVPRSLHPA